MGDGKWGRGRQDSPNVFQGLSDTQRTPQHLFSAFLVIHCKVHVLKHFADTRPNQQGKPMFIS